MKKVDGGDGKFVSVSANKRGVTSLSGLMVTAAEVKSFLAEHPVAIAHVNRMFEGLERATASAERINAVFTDPYAKVDKYIEVLEQESPLTPAVMLELFALRDDVIKNRLDEFKSAAEEERRRYASDGALVRWGEYPEQWRAAVLQIYRAKQSSDRPYKSLPKAASDMADQILGLVHDDGVTVKEVQAPSYRSIYAYLLEARNEKLI